MKLFISLLLACSLFTYSAIGQKLDFETVEINHTWLPSVFLPYDIKTYKGIVAPNPGHQLNLRLSDTLNREIVLPGFQYADKDYDLAILLLLDSLSIGKMELGSFAFYNQPAKLNIVSYSGQVYLDSTITINGLYHKFTVEPGKPKIELLADWQKNIRLYKADWEGKLYNSYKDIINRILAKDFAYRPYRARHQIGMPGNSKKTSFDFTMYEKASELLKQGFKERSADDLSTGKEKIGAAITIWEERLSLQDDVKEKAGIDKKVAYATHLNAAVAYLWLPDFEKASYHIQKADDLKSLLSGGDFANTRNSINLFKTTYNLHPGWTGRRKQEPRKMKSVFLTKEGSPFEASVKASNKWLEANPVSAAGSSQMDQSNPLVKSLINKKWKFEKIIQLTPGQPERVVFEKNKMDGKGLSSTERIRFTYFLDGTSIYLNPSGEENKGNWSPYSSGQLLINGEIVQVITLSNTEFVYLQGKTGGSQVKNYLSASGDENTGMSSAVSTKNTNAPSINTPLVINFKDTANGEKLFRNAINIAATYYKNARVRTDDKMSMKALERSKDGRKIVLRSYTEKRLTGIAYETGGDIHKCWINLSIERMENSLVIKILQIDNGLEGDVEYIHSKVYSNWSPVYLKAFGNFCEESGNGMLTKLQNECKE